MVPDAAPDSRTDPLHLRTVVNHEVVTLATAVARLEHAVRRHEQLTSDGKPTRYVQAIEVIDEWAWLRGAAPTDMRCYWASRDNAIRVAGIGTAWTTEGPDAQTLREVPSDDAAAAPYGLRAFVSARFPTLPRAAACIAADPSQVSEESEEQDEPWAAFAPVRVRVPALELRRAGERAWLIATIARDEAPDRWRARFARAAKPREDSAPAIAARPTDAGAAATWSGGVAELLHAFDTQQGMEKVVLSRTQEFEATGPIDPVDILARLDAQGAGAYRFLVEARPGVAFVGASPERLFRRRARQLTTEALAGTTRVDSDPVRNVAQGAALLASAKDREEHAIVRRHIEARLAPFVQDLACAQAPELLPAGPVQHLHTRIEGALRDETDDADLLGALHPTPAVCGHPTEDALAWLAAHEPHERGLYAGAIGLVGQAEAEFAVAIRSALIRNRSIRCYAGAGIVPGSEAEREWLEVEDKFSVVAQALADRS